MSNLDKEVFRLESQKEGYEESTEKQINYMWDEYEITYGHAQELRDANLTDLSKMKKCIQELKGEIRQLGSVNVNAIEDYKNVSERYTFLKNQHDDLWKRKRHWNRSLRSWIQRCVSSSGSSLNGSARNLTPYSKNCSVVVKERLSLWKMKIFWKQESALSHSHRERNCKI